MTCSRERPGRVPELWSKPLWENVWPFLDPLDSCASTHSFHALARSREVWAALRALVSSLSKRSQWWLEMRCCHIRLSLRKRSRRVRWLVCTFWRLTSKWDQAAANLLIWETCGDAVAQKATIGTTTAYRCPKVKVLSSSDFREHNVESLALHVIGLSWSSEGCPLSWKVKCHDDTCCTERMMKQGFTALKSEDWEEYKAFFRG